MDHSHEPGTRISGLTIGYGFRPARALLGLLLTIALSLGVVFVAQLRNWLSQPVAMNHSLWLCVAANSQRC